MSRRRSRIALAIAAAALALLFARAPDANAQPALGAKNQLVIDQISGFRMSTDGNLNYYGPIGVSFRSYTARDFDVRVTRDVTTKFTSFWLAPSADIFVIDHLSVGGLLEVSTTSTSVDVTTNGNTASTSRPSTTNFTLMPRVGWLFNIGESFGIWPRLGIGYASRQIANTSGSTTQRDTTSGVVFDVDVAFVYRLPGSWFVKAAPQLSFAPGASHTLSDSATNTEQSANASAFLLAVVAGIGVAWDL